jgi:hypothetical protein
LKKSNATKDMFLKSWHIDNIGVDYILFAGTGVSARDENVIFISAN